MIVRVSREENPYAQIDRACLNDERLSFKARGILSWLLSKPNGWQIIVKAIVKAGPDGRDSVYAGLRELAQHGYLRREEVRDPVTKRFLRVEQVVYERPSEAPRPAFPDTENPDTAFPDTENPPLDIREGSYSIHDLEEKTTTSGAAPRRPWSELVKDLNHVERAVFSTARADARLAPLAEGVLEAGLWHNLALMKKSSRSPDSVFSAWLPALVDDLSAAGLERVEAALGYTVTQTLREPRAAWNFYRKVLSAARAAPAPSRDAKGEVTFGAGFLADLERDLMED